MIVVLVGDEELVLNQSKASLLVIKGVDEATGRTVRFVSSPDHVSETIMMMIEGGHNRARVAVPDSHIAAIDGLPVKLSSLTRRNRKVEP